MAGVRENDNSVIKIDVQNEQTGLEMGQADVPLNYDDAMKSSMQSLKDDGNGKNDMELRE